MIEQSSMVLSAMANARRLEILVALQEHGELCVGELNKYVPITQSALSQHLSVLRAGKLVSTRRFSQTIYYSLSSSAVIAIMEALVVLLPESSDRSVEENM